MSTESPTCPTCAATCAEVQRLRELCRKQQAEIEDLTGFADAVEVLRDIGKLIGCGHVDSPDERRQLVNCVEQSLAEGRDEVASLRITAQAFASCLLSVRKQNTDEWMDYAAGAFNDLCDVLKTGDRFQYDGRDGLRKVK